MEIIYITLLTILAGGVGTLTGFGMSTIMVPAVLLLLPLPQTLLLVGVIHWFGDIWKVALFKKGFRWKLILTFGLPGIAASWLGANLVFVVSERILSQLLGGFMIGYVLFLFLKPAFKIPQHLLTAVSGGSLSGFFAGIFGVGGAVRGVFLSVFDLPKAVYIATAGAIALFTDTARIATYIHNGVTLERQFLWGFLLFIPASFIGAGAAKKIIDRMPQDKFRTVVAAGLFLVGIKFILFPS